MIPIPEELRKSLDKPTANFSLLFPRLVEWKTATGTDKLESKGAIEVLKNKFKPHANLLQKLHKKQQKILECYSSEKFEISAQLTQPFVSGLGSGHPTETGFILDRNSGLPYIPASSIKGVLRSLCEAKANELFGDRNGKQQGQIIILDAFSKENPELQIDIINPHSKDETKNPIPIKFLIVPKGTVFVFRGLAPKDSNINELFQKAFEHGFGAKTNIGYGKFTSDINKEEKFVSQPKAKLKVGEKYTATLVEKPKKSWKAKIEDSNITIVNSDKIPPDKKADDCVNVILKSLPNASNAGNAEYCA